MPQYLPAKIQDFITKQEKMWGDPKTATFPYFPTFLITFSIL